MRAREHRHGSVRVHGRCVVIVVREVEHGALLPRHVHEIEIVLRLRARVDDLGLDLRAALPDAGRLDLLAYGSGIWLRSAPEQHSHGQRRNRHPLHHRHPLLLAARRKTRNLAPCHRTIGPTTSPAVRGEKISLRPRSPADLDADRLRCGDASPQHASRSSGGSVPGSNDLIPPTTAALPRGAGPRAARPRCTAGNSRLLASSTSCARQRRLCHLLISMAASGPYFSMRNLSR